MAALWECYTTRRAMRPASADSLICPLYDKHKVRRQIAKCINCLLYTSDAADE